MAPQQLEAILAHELAHIRRHDYLVNLLQTLVETLLFYHPAVWWLSRRIRDRARELLRRSRGQPVRRSRRVREGARRSRGAARGSRRLVLAATGGSLLHRVRRLLAAPSHAGRARDGSPAARRSSSDRRHRGWSGRRTSVLECGSTADAIAARMRGRRFGSDDSTPNDARRVGSHRAPAAGTASRRCRHRSPVVAECTDPRERRRRPLRRRRASLDESVRTPSQTCSSSSSGGRPSRSRHRRPPLAADRPRCRRRRRSRRQSHRRRRNHRSPDPPTPPQPPDRRSSTPDRPSRRRRRHRRHLPVRRRSEAVGQSTRSISRGPTATREAGGQARRRGRVHRRRPDVKSLSPGGMLRDQGRRTGPSSRTIEFRADGDRATIERRYWVGIVGEARSSLKVRQWLAQALPRFIRQTGIGAAGARRADPEGEGALGRARRDHADRGQLGEARLLHASCSRRRRLDAGDGAAGARPGRPRDRLGLRAGVSLLIAADQPARGRRDAAASTSTPRKSIQSDFEMRRVYSSRAQAGAAIAGRARRRCSTPARAIDSDFEEADASGAGREAAGARRARARPVLQGPRDGEQRLRAARVLTARCRAGRSRRPRRRARCWSRRSRSGRTSSRRRSCSQIVKSQSIDGRAAGAVLQGRGRHRLVVRARARAAGRGEARRSLPPETVLGVAARRRRTMSSSFETSQVLLAVAATHPITGEARDLYIDGRRDSSATSNRAGR